MFDRLLSLILCLPLVSCACHNYLQGDVYFNQSISSSSYCAPIIRWPISDNTISNYSLLDSTAQSLYNQLYSRYKNNPGTVEVDCLGIARYVFCAYAYPTCIPADSYGVQSNDTSDKMNVCQWLCDLWIVRCPTEFEVYGQICKNQKGDTCSWGKWLGRGISAVVLMMIVM